MASDLSFLIIYLVGVFVVIKVWVLFAFTWFVIEIVGYFMKAGVVKSSKSAAIWATSLSSLAAAGSVPPEKDINILMSIIVALVLCGVFAMFIRFIRLRVHALIFK